MEINQLAIIKEAVKIRQQLPGVGTEKLHYLLTDFLAKITDAYSHKIEGYSTRYHLTDERTNDRSTDGG